MPLAASSMASRGGVMLCALLLLQLAGPLPSCNGSSSVYQPRLPLDMSHWDYVDKVPRFPHQPKIELPDRLWALHDLPRAVAHSNPSSLHAMLRKLSAGEPITVVALGSSVTSDFGGCFGREERIQDMVEIMSLVYPRHKCGWHGWIHCMMHIINATWPHEDHVLINNGLPGATGKTYGSGTCMELNLPDQADLIIMEHHAADEAATKVMEHLLWRLNDHFDKKLPPFVLVNTMRVVETAEEGKCISDIRLCPTNCPNMTGYHIRKSFGGVQYGEDWLHSLASYYGLAGSLSVRDWMHSAFRDGMHVRLNMTECQYLSTLLLDPIHPSDLGRVLFGDWLTYLLLQAEESLHSATLMAAIAAGETSGSEAADSMEVEDNRTWANFDSPALMPRAPLVSGADRVYKMRCYGVLGGALFGEDLSTTLDLQPGTSGWEFVEHQLHGTEKKYKPGWVATQPGSKLLVKIDSLFDGVPPEEDVTAAIGYLVSYEHMGKARGKCVSGCMCRNFTMNGLSTAKRTSLVSLREFSVSQHKECVVEIELISETDDLAGGTKFKIAQLAVKARKSAVAEALRTDALG